MRKSIHTPRSIFRARLVGGATFGYVWGLFRGFADSVELREMLLLACIPMAAGIVAAVAGHHFLGAPEDYTPARYIGTFGLIGLLFFGGSYFMMPGAYAGLIASSPGAAIGGGIVAGAACGAILFFGRK